jgi:hypothetical protein
MTKEEIREDIIRMAREAGCIESAIPDWVIRTCALVASAEREACALMCEEFELLHVAEAIRYRGKA